MWPFIVSSDSGKCILTVATVSPGQVTKFSTIIAFIHVASTGYLADAWRYLTVWGMDGKLNSLCVSFCLMALFFSADTIHNFPVLLLHTWRIGGSLVVMVIVPSLSMVIPSLPGKKHVLLCKMSPASNFFLMRKAKK